MLEEPYRVVGGVDLEKFTPRPKHCVIRWLKKLESKGGILYPENRQRKNYMRGIILRLADDCDPALKVGDSIQFESLAEKEFLGPQDPTDRDSVFIMRSEDIHAIAHIENGVARLEPVNDYVLIRPNKGADAVAGLAIPGSADRRMGIGWTGEVIAISRETKENDEFQDIVPGVNVAYNNSCEIEVIVNGEHLGIIRNVYVECVVDEGSPELVGAL